MSLRTVFPGKTLLIIPAVVLTAFLLLYFTDYQRRETSARTLLSAWNLIDAEHELRSLTNDYPESLEARRLYADCLYKRGELFGARNEFTRLIVSDSTLASSHTLSLAFTYFYLGNLDTAYRLANAVAVRSHPESPIKGGAFNLLGRIAFNRAQYDSAMVFQLNSLRLARLSGSRQVEADALRQIGVLYWYHDKPDSARLTFYAPALNIYRSINDRIGEATTLNNLGLAGGPMKYYLEAFAIRKKTGDQIGLADSYYFVAGGGFNHWFDLMYGLRKKSLELSKRIGYKWGEEVAARAVEDMVVSAYDSLLFDPRVVDQDANASGEQIIQRMQRQSSQRAREGKWKDAVALHERIISMSDSMGYSIGLGQSLQHYVAALLPLGEYRKAESAALRLRHIPSSDPIGAGSTLAKVYLASGHYGRAAKLTDSLTRQCDKEYLSRLARKDVDLPLESAGVLTLRFHLYSMLLAALKQVGSGEEVFEALERFRALPFGFSAGSGDATIVDGEESIWHRYVRTLEELEKSPDNADRSIREFDHAYRQVSEQYTAASHASKHLLEQTIPRMAEVQQTMRDDQVLLEYFMGKEVAYVFALRRDAFSFMKLNQSAGDINSSVRAFRDLLLRGTTSPEDGLWKDPGAFLFRTLIQPVIQRGFLTMGDHLIVSPHGRLLEVPFACLVDSSGEFLLERFTLSYVPGASSILIRRKATGPASFLALVPDRSSLPFAGKEVEDVSARLFSSRKVLFDAAATTAALADQAPGADFIHIAAHASMHRWHPLFSHLQMSDGPFQLYRTLNLKLSSSLVVLSSCETGYGVGMMGDIEQGHEVVSFPRAFLSAGALSVIAPLWIVEDEATSHLMTSFYSQLDSLKQSGSPLPAGSFARALTLAQLRFARNADPRRAKTHPFYWAGFYVTGATN